MAASLDFVGLNARIAAGADNWLRAWLPEGVAESGQWCVGSLNGEKGKSLKISMTTGAWIDHASGEKGGDFISLYAALNTLDQGEAYRALQDRMGLEPAPTAKPQLRIVPPHERKFEMPPADAETGADVFAHPSWGEPSTVYYYRTTDARLICVVARYEYGGDKKFCPWTWRAGGWRPEGPPTPRPLYGLEQLHADNVGKLVIIVEGEKAADALRGLLGPGGQPVITWSNGAKSVRKADWQALTGRKVLVWPDADPAGVQAATDVCEVLRGIDERWPIAVIRPPEGAPKGWDVADAIAAGWDRARLAAFIKANRYDYALPAAGQLTLAGEGTPATQVAGKAGPAGIPSAGELHQLAGLAVGRKGAHPNLDNAGRVITYGLAHMDIWPEIWFDTFIQRLLYRREDGAVMQWSDDMDTRLTQDIQRIFDIPQMGVDAVRRAVESYARAHPQNCVQQWLKGLVWDGADRLDKLMTGGFGAEWNDYSRAVGRCFLVGMVARAMDPGCKVDNMPVFEGPQGATKGQALKAIGGPWFAEVHDTITSKDFKMSLQGKWLVEISELHSFQGREMEAIKGIISCQVDTFRAPYDRHAADYPRQSVFAGSTNRDDYNADETGARRFWPVKCGPIDLQWIKDNREQLFAEALVRYSRGEPWWDVPEATARAEQEDRRVQHPWARRIERYCSGMDTVVMEDVLRDCLEIPVDRHDMRVARTVGSILRELGYVKSVMREPASGGRPAGPAYKAWRRPIVRPGNLKLEV